jgi:hypothetical protein
MNSSFESLDRFHYSMVEYSHLTSLDVAYGHKDYLEQFLNETKAPSFLRIQYTLMYVYLSP